MEDQCLYDYWQGVSLEEAGKQFDSIWGYIPRDFRSVLDVGGGIGGLKYSLDKNGYSSTYTLLENSTAAIIRAKELGIEAVSCDFDKHCMPFADNSFDLVFVSDVLEHLHNPWVVLGECARVSKKYIFVHGPNFASLRCRIDLLRGYPIREMVYDRHGGLIDKNGRHCSHIYFITYNNLIYWGRQCGFEVMKSRIFWYKRYMLFRWFLEPFFKNFGNQYEIVFKKHSVPFFTNPNLRF